MSLFQKIIYLIFLITISFEFENRKLTEIENLEIENIFDSMISSPSNPLNIILQTSNISDKEKLCPLCKKAIVEIRETIIKKYGYEGALKFFISLCNLGLDADVCESAIRGYGPTFFNSLSKLIINENKFCSTINLCPSSEKKINVDEYARNLLKSKPDKKKEKIQNKNTIKMLQLTDVHFDLYYKENASAYCTKLLCCRDPPTPYAKILSGKYGFPGKCDTNKNLFESFLDYSYNLKPDFIIWTGDNAPHDVWLGSQEHVYNSTIILKDMIDMKYKGEIPIYPILGNHEKYPNDEFGENESELLEKMADIYKSYLSDEAYETFKKYGYYTMMHKNTNLRIIALNCLYCDTFNFNLLVNQKGAKNQFKWLEETLLLAEKNNEYVYILDHIPLNANFYLTECAKRMIALLDRFDYIVRGYFGGHTHIDDINPVKNYFEPHNVININYVAPSFTPYPRVLPSFRLYLIDDETYLVKDYEQYRLNLTKANIEKVANWELSHYGSKIFNVSDLSEMTKMTQRKVDGEFIIKRFGDSEVGYSKVNNKNDIKEAQCSIDSVNFSDWMKCAHPTLDINYNHIFTLLNTMSGEWKEDDS